MDAGRPSSAASAAAASSSSTSSPLLFGGALPSSLPGLSGTLSSSYGGQAPPIIPLPTRSLAETLRLEVCSAVVSSALVAPLISIIDRSIIANASGLQPLGAGIASGLHMLATRPHHFVRQPSFLLIWGLYAATYTAANCTEAVVRRRHRENASVERAAYSGSIPVTSASSATANSSSRGSTTIDDKSAEDAAVQLPKFLVSSATNVSLSVAKDYVFTRMFGVGPAKSVPLPSYALFTVRDSLTVLAGFTLPPIISAYAQREYAVSKRAADISCQLIVPCAMQLLSCPMHLLGLDLYNRQGVSTQSRVAFIRREYVGTAAARIGRIFPAYGIGGVVNKSLRERLLG